MKIRDKVLIVEDEQNIKNFMSTILAANGFDTLMAGSAKEALSMISSHCPDLIILDLGLPDMDGMEVLKQVRAWSSVPVIVVSARTHEGDKVAALDLGADDYIEKPFGTSELLARIRTAIRHTRTGLDNDSIAQSGKYHGPRPDHRLRQAPCPHARGGRSPHAQRVQDRGAAGQIRR